MKRYWNTDFPDDFLSEEEREGHLVSEEMKKLWAVEIDILMQIVDICERHGIRWYASSGTVLGAVRHGGFIPWDDDIDIEMLREDYDRFAEVAKRELKTPYFLQDGETDPTACHCHIQVRNSATTGILRGDLPRKFPFNQGAFVDIFPIDRVPASRKAFERQARLLLILKGRAYKIRDYVYSHEGEENFSVVKRIGRAMMRPVAKPLLRLLQRVYRGVSRRYEKTESTRVVSMSLPPVKMERNMHESMYGDGVELDYEFFKIKVPSDYEAYLTELYGDWRTPIKGGAFHSGIVFDPEKPYTEYLR